MTVLGLIFRICFQIWHLVLEIDILWGNGFITPTVPIISKSWQFLAMVLPVYKIHFVCMHLTCNGPLWKKFAIGCDFCGNGDCHKNCYKWFTYINHEFSAQENIIVMRAYKTLMQINKIFWWYIILILLES